MTIKLRPWVCTIPLVLFLWGCPQQGSQGLDGGADSTRDVVVLPDATSNTAEEERHPTAAELPIPEDFEGEALRAIDEGNYRRALETLESEIIDDSRR